MTVYDLIESSFFRFAVYYVNGEPFNTAHDAIERWGNEEVVRWDLLSDTDGYGNRRIKLDIET